MHAVVNTVALERPIDDSVWEAARRDLTPQIASVEGVQSVQIVRTGEREIVIVIVGEDEAALDRMRDAIGNEWMRANVIPNAAGPPQRAVGEVLVHFQRV